MTLAVIDMGKLRSSGFAQALIAMDNTLKSQIREGDGSELLYYDEAGSVEGSIRYSVDTEPYRDLGNLAGQLCVCLKEPKKHLDGDGMYTRFNDYENASKKICSILGNEEIIYVRGSNGITAPEKAHIDGNGEIKYESMSTSGLYLFFPTIWNAEGAVEYYEEMCKLANGGNVRDADCVSFLSSYSNTVLDYALLTETGSAVTALVGNGVSKGEIDYAKVREYWESTFVLRGYDLDSHTFIKTSLWDKAVKNLFAAAGGEEAVAPWLEKLISQQAGDAVQAGNVSASKIQKLDGEGLMVHIDKTDKRVVDSVNVNYVTELPAVFEYYKSRYGNTPEVQATAAHDSKLPIGTLGGSEDYSGLDIDIQTMSIDEILDCYSKWYEADSSAWVFGEASKRMFALEDAQGNLHAAQVIIEPNGKAKTYIEYQEDDADYDDYSTQKGVLVFNKESDETYALSEFYPSVDEFSRPMTADDLKAGIDGVKTVYRFRDESPLFTVPITKNGFTISKDTMKSIRLVYANIDDVEDIADIDGDGEKIQERYVVKDMYHHETDITDAVKNASGETIYDIGLADVENVTFNGKDQGPKLTFKGAALEEGVDYEFAKSELIGECRSVGSYEGTVIGKGRFTGSREVAFSILAKKINPSVALAADEYTYNGKAQKPSVTVKDGKTKLSSSDYTVSYQAGCKNVGSYRVSVKLKGNYEGNVAVKFKIVPKGTSLRKAKQSNKAATVIWKPQKKKMSKKRITGYEIQVATNKSFTKNKKTVTVKGYKKTSKRITGLKQNKKYFVRVRTYLKARGGMFCSSWSKAKPIK